MIIPISKHFSFDFIWQGVDNEMLKFDVTFIIDIDDVLMYG